MLRRRLFTATTLVVSYAMINSLLVFLLPYIMLTHKRHLSIAGLRTINVNTIRIEYSLTVGIARTLAIVAPLATVISHELLGPSRTLSIILTFYSIAALAVVIQPELLTTLITYIIFVAFSHMMWPLIRTIYARLSRAGGGARIFAILRVFSELSPRIAPLIAASTLYLAYYLTGNDDLRTLIVDAYIFLYIPLVALLWASSLALIRQDVLPNIKRRRTASDVKMLKGLPLFHLFSAATNGFARGVFGTAVVLYILNRISAKPVDYGLISTIPALATLPLSLATVTLLDKLTILEKILLFMILGVLSRASMYLMAFAYTLAAALIVLSFYNLFDYTFFPFMRDVQAKLFDERVLVAYYSVEQMMYTLLMGLGSASVAVFYAIDPSLCFTLASITGAIGITVAGIATLKYYNTCRERRP